MKVVKKCTECDRPVLCRDLCSTHYRRELKYGNALIIKKPFGDYYFEYIHISGVLVMVPAVIKNDQWVEREAVEVSVKRRRARRAA